MIKYEVTVTQKRTIILGEQATEVSDNISGRFNEWEWGELVAFIRRVIENFDDVKIEIGATDDKKEKEKEEEATDELGL